MNFKPSAKVFGWFSLSSKPPKVKELELRFGLDILEAPGSSLVISENAESVLVSVQNSPLTGVKSMFWLMELVFRPFIMCSSLSDLTLLVVLNDRPSVC